jgi:hypothetical protein
VRHASDNLYNLYKRVLNKKGGFLCVMCYTVVNVSPKTTYPTFIDSWPGSCVCQLCVCVCVCVCVFPLNQSTDNTEPATIATPARLACALHQPCLARRPYGALTTFQKVAGFESCFARMASPDRHNMMRPLLVQIRLRSSMSHHDPRPPNAQRTPRMILPSFVCRALSVPAMVMSFHLAWFLLCDWDRVTRTASRQCRPWREQ